TVLPFCYCLGFFFSCCNTNFLCVPIKQRRRRKEKNALLKRKLNSLTMSRGLFVKQKCTATTDTVCDVFNGYYCKGLTDSNGCSLAEKHSQCAAGQRIKEPGTSRSDTVCEDCQPGFFSKDGVNCTGWKTCSESQIKVEEGSSTSDVVCESPSRHRYFFISSVVLLLIIAICLVTTGFVKAR
uniref:TNFR-Cys domain-containing protein n=1 Tax=Neolamprologus brichardi TaxID=32507 RepID=A0A3Q4H2U4_NEOBR